jgi:hypothetical protein
LFLKKVKKGGETENLVKGLLLSSDFFQRVKEKEKTALVCFHRSVFIGQGSGRAVFHRIVFKG